MTQLRSLIKELRRVVGFNPKHYSAPKMFTMDKSDENASLYALEQARDALRQLVDQNQDHPDTAKYYTDLYNQVDMQVRKERREYSNSGRPADPHHPELGE